LIQVSDLASLYRRWLRPAAGVLAALSAAAAIVLFLAMDSEAERGMTETLQQVVLVALVCLGVVLPAALALLGRRVRVRWAVVVFVPAGMVNAVCLGEPVAIAPQGVFSLLGVFVGLAMATVGLVVGAEGHERRPVAGTL
jgi:hypothetical protein